MASYHQIADRVFPSSLGTLEPPTRLSIGSGGIDCQKIKIYIRCVGNGFRDFYEAGTASEGWFRWTRGEEGVKNHCGHGDPLFYNIFEWPGGKILHLHVGCRGASNLATLIFPCSIARSKAYAVGRG